MLGWSINLFRVRGIQVAVHYSFFLLLAYVANVGWHDEDGGGWPGLLWYCAALLAFFGCVLLHELGHSFTAMHYSIGIRRILLMPIGGMAQFEDIPREPVRELLITLAGPAVNFGIAALLWGWTDWFGADVQEYSVRGLVNQLFAANLLMGCFNLLPVFPMDGGRILRALLATQTSYLRATAWAATIGKILAIIGVVVALLAFGGKHYLTAVLFLFVMFAGEAEYRAVKRRELDDAQWRELAERAHELRRMRITLVPRIEEPPLLEEPPFLAPQENQNAAGTDPGGV